MSKLLCSKKLVLMLICLIVICNLLLCQKAWQEPESDFTVINAVKVIQSSDSLQLRLNFTKNLVVWSTTKKVVQLDSRVFIRKVKVRKNTYTNIGIYNKKRQIYGYLYLLINLGDTLVVSGYPGKIMLSGSSAISTQLVLKKIYDSLNNSRGEAFTGIHGFKESFRHYDSITTLQMTELYKRRKNLQLGVYEQFRLNVLTQNQVVKQSLLIDSFNKAAGIKITDAKYDVRKNPNINISFFDFYQTYNDSFKTILKEHAIIWIPLLHNSFFAEYVYKQYIIDSCIALNRGFNVNAYIDYLERTQPKSLLEKLYLELFYIFGQSEHDMRSAYYKGKNVVTDPILKGVLSRYANKLPGVSFCDFILPSSKGVWVNSNSLKGKVILMDFWFTGCPNCPVMYSKLKPIEQKFEGNANVIFVSVNVDESQTTWLNSVRNVSQKSVAYTSELPNVINVNTEGEGRSHSLIRFYDIMGYPTLLLFDKGGKLVPIKDPRLDNGKALKLTIDSLLGN